MKKILIELIESFEYKKGEHKNQFEYNGQTRYVTYTIEKDFVTVMILNDMPFDEVPNDLVGIVTTTLEALTVEGYNDVNNKIKELKKLL